MLIRVAWPEELLACDMGKEVKDPATGTILFAGLRAKCSIFHGPMSKIVPHTTTGELSMAAELAVCLIFCPNLGRCNAIG